MCEDVAVLIAGGGPAGSSCAIEIANTSALLAAKTVLIDKSRFPRFKPCAGGLTTSAISHLVALGIPVGDIPSASVSEIQLMLLGHSRALTYRQANLLHIVTRYDLDHLLLKAAQEKGVSVREGERLLGIRDMPDCVLVETTRQKYRAQIVVAADGAHSRVRSIVDPGRHSSVMWAAEASVTTERSLAGSAIFRYGLKARGVWGYTWDFPKVDGRGERLIGVAVTRPSDVAVNKELGRLLISEALTPWSATMTGRSIQGQARLFSPGLSFARPRVVFAGDAAGTDPLWGEGITSALGMGRIAARSAIEALRWGDFEMRNYHQRITSSPTGRKLRLRQILAGLPPRTEWSGLAILLDAAHSRLRGHVRQR